MNATTYPWTKEELIKIVSLFCTTFAELYKELQDVLRGPVLIMTNVSFHEEVIEIPTSQDQKLCLNSVRANVNQVNKKDSRWDWRHKFSMYYMTFGNKYCLN